jgi:hypothetical protein
LLQGQDSTLTAPGCGGPGISPSDGFHESEFVHLALSREDQISKLWLHVMCVYRLATVAKVSTQSSTQFRASLRVLTCSYRAMSVAPRRWISKGLVTVNMASVSKRKSGGGTLAACLRCHRRKQRCSGFPSCVNCQAASVACKRESTPAMRRLAGLSKQDLIDHIVKLEDALDTDSHQSPGERHQSIVTTSTATDTPCQDQSPTDATVVPEACGPSSTQSPSLKPSDDRVCLNPLHGIAR